MLTPTRLATWHWRKRQDLARDLSRTQQGCDFDKAARIAEMPLMDVAMNGKIAVRAKGEIAGGGDRWRKAA